MSTTTLRINDAVYREAKAEAAREGLSITRFIEDALRLRLAHKKPRRINLPSYDSGGKLPENFDLPSFIREEEEVYSAELADKTTDKNHSRASRKRRA